MSTTRVKIYTTGNTGASRQASATTFTPAGSIAAGNVQAALVELDNEKQPKAARVTFSNADYTITAPAGDLDVAQVGTLTAPRTVTLPAASAVAAGTEIIVDDDSGSVTATNTITVVRAGSDTINGATSEVIAAAYGARRFISNGSNAWSFDAGMVRSSTLTTDGDILTRAAGVPARITRANLAADTSFSSRYAAFAGQGEGGPGFLTRYAIAAESTTPRVLDTWGGAVYGSKSDGTIWRSLDEGVTWAQIATGPVASFLTRILPTSDGEVLLVYSATIRKSTGWATNPATVTWSTKVTANSPAYFLNWGFDGNGTKFIATEYASAGDWAASNNAWISTDSGNTWTVVWDQAARFPGDGALSHCHAVCYDPWQDLFFLSEGHSVSKGVYWSSNNGATWTLVNGMAIDGAPTVLVATDSGIVCGTDSAPGGVYGIARRTNPAEMEGKLLWNWWPGRAGIVGFAQRGFRDTRNGVVYFGTNSSFADVKPVFVGATALAAGLVWEAPTAENGGRIWNQVITPNGKLIMSYESPAAGGYQIVTGFLSQYPAVDTQRLNAGNILGATNAEPTSVAIGYGASVPSAAVESVVIGSGASVSSTGQSVIIGEKATGPATCVIIGDGTSATGAGNVVVGQGATVTGTSTQVSVVVGQNATANLSGNTAVGAGASATNSQSTAIGRLASAAANDSVAIGRSSSAPAGWNGSVALGASTTVTAASQIQIGARHIEMSELAADPSAGATNNARLYAKDNGSGKTQLCVRFPTGAVAVLATEP